MREILGKDVVFLTIFKILSTYFILNISFVIFELEKLEIPHVKMQFTLHTSISIVISRKK